MEHYKFLEGWFRPANMLRFFWQIITGYNRSGRIGGEFTFDQACLTPSADPDDINKLFGLSFDINHHCCSLRFGWRATMTKDGMRIGLFYYSYLGHVRTHRLIGTVNADEPVRLAMCRLPSNRYLMMLITDDQTLSFQTPEYYPKRFLYKRLYPYFGGSEPAPVDMLITAKWRNYTRKSI
jgi:hypothetical protein